MFNSELPVTGSSLSMPYQLMFIFLARLFTDMEITCTDEAMVSVWDLSVVISQRLNI